MTRTPRNGDIDALLQSGDWSAARTLLEQERKKEPNNHWVLTQIGVTYYEQRQYQQALPLFLESRNLMPECPLTLWNLAGTLDSLGHHTGALRLYTWLLQSDRTPQEDPCWESKPWTDALKTDCVFRMGLVLQNLGKTQKAERCYHQYLRLLSIGMEGSYSMDEVKRQVRELRRSSSRGGIEREFNEAVDEALEIAGFPSHQARERRPPPEVKIPRLRAS